MMRNFHPSSPSFPFFILHCQDVYFIHNRSLWKLPLAFLNFAGTFLVKCAQYGKLTLALLYTDALGSNLTVIQSTVIALLPWSTNLIFYPKTNFKVKIIRHLHQLMGRVPLGILDCILMSPISLHIGRIYLNSVIALMICK